MAAASRDYDAFDRRFAYQTWLTFAAVNAMLELKKSFFAIGTYVIGNA